MSGEPEARHEYAIEALGLTRRFGDFVAVDGLDLRVPRGSFFAFLGTNGAGKTTTLRMMTGLLRPTSGDVRVEGHSILSAPVEVKRCIGVVPDDLALFDHLTFFEHLTLVGRIHELGAEETARRARDLLQVLELAADGGVLASQGSTGMRKKLALAMALLPRPAVLFLDEPFESIDPLTGATIRDLLNALAKSGTTIVLTSHILEIVERLADRVAILAHGKLAFESSMQDLRASGRTLEDEFRTAAGREHEAPLDLPWLF